MNDAVQLKKARMICKGKFTRLNNTITRNISDGSSHTLIEKRFADLKIIWNELQRKHEDYLLAEESEIDESVIEEVQMQFEETESKVDIIIRE